MEMATGFDPLLQEIKAVRKGDMPAFKLILKKRGIQMQRLGFDIAEDNGGRPFQPFVKILRRHVVKLPRRNGNDLRVRNPLQGADQELGVVQHFKVLDR